MDLKHQIFSSKVARDREEIYFLAYGQPLTNFKDLKYPDIFFSENDNDCPAVVTGSRRHCTLKSHQTLKNLELVPSKINPPPHPLWMSPDSIHLIDRRASLPRKPCPSRKATRGITRAFRRSFMADSRRRA